MSSRPILALALLLLAATACKSTSTTTTTVTGTPRVERIPDANPIGRWSLALVAQGQAMQVTMEITKKEDGSLAGVITSDAFPPIPITKAVVEGKTLTATFVAPTPNSENGTFVLVIDGDTLEGEWSMPGDGSKVSGKRL